MTALRFYDAVTTACDSNLQMRKIVNFPNKNRDKNNNEDSKNNENNTNNDKNLLSSLIKLYTDIFLEGHVRTSILSSGEQHSSAAFKVTKILLTELQKNSKNGILLETTTRFLCNRQYVRSDRTQIELKLGNELIENYHQFNGNEKNEKNEINSLRTPVKNNSQFNKDDNYNNNNHDNNNNNNDNNNTASQDDKINLISTIIKRGKSKNKNLSVSSSLLLSTILRVSDIEVAIHVLLKQNECIRRGSGNDSVDNSLKMPISIENSPNLPNSIENYFLQEFVENYFHFFHFFHYH